jgi:2',3'-cyclic-nucleotide 2'-phosphodiesterase/3'-nucleotidase
MNRRRGTFSAVICTLLLLAPVWAGGAAEKVTLTLLGTTDIHGHIMPWDYYKNAPANLGLVKIAALVSQVRATAPNVLLLDSGDTIQGTPLAYYFARKDTSFPNPTIATMNAMHYAAMAVGNHEFNFGENVMWKAKRESHFPWLAANLREKYQLGDSGYIRPYIIRTVAGVRIGIVGFVTPAVPHWEIPAHYQGYEFEPIVDAAKRVIPEVRKQADIVVAIMHSGLDRNPDTEAPEADQIRGENCAWELAEQVPGIDVIFFGHTHRELPEKLVHGVLLTQAKNWGGSLARADIEMERDPDDRWRVASKHSSVLRVTEQTPADPEIVKLAQPYHDATQKYLDTPIATSEKPLDGVFARYEDDPLVDLIHKVQMEYGHADVSMATLFFLGAHFPAGPVTIRQIAALYIYENTLYTVEMTGAQLKDALEHAASFFPAWPSPVSERLKLPGYEADSAEGVSYVVDLTQPAGVRIRGLTYKGKPLDPAQKLRVAINNYRYTGGGGYHVYQGLPVVYRSPEETRDLIIEYVSKTHRIPTEADDNWRVEPPEALAAMLAEGQRERESAGRQ